MTNEVVSIYIPTCNRRSLLERAVKSVLDQTYPKIEVIVANDASSDGTREFLDEWARGEPRLIPIHHETRRGAPAARNNAIRAATGFFITGLDDDDEFLPDRIERFVEAWDTSRMTDPSRSCIFTDSLMFDGFRSKITTDRKDCVSYLDLFVHNFVGNQVFCPRDYLLSVGGFDEQLPAWQDLDLFIRLLRQHGHATRISAANYVCHIEPSRERISKNATNRYFAFERIVAKYPVLTADLRHALFLQIFAGYGTTPAIADWRRLLRERAHARHLIRLFRIGARNSLRNRLSILRR